MSPQFPRQAVAASGNALGRVVAEPGDQVGALGRKGVPISGNVETRGNDMS